MDGKWCDDYCKEQNLTNCNDCAIYEAIQKLGRYETSEETRMIADIILTGLLTILLITLKLRGVINWSWLWIFSPLWGLIAGRLTFLLIVLHIQLVVKMAKKMGRRKNE